MNGRSRTSFDKVMVHAWREQEGGLARLSVCGGIASMNLLIDATLDPVTCKACLIGAVAEAVERLKAAE